jgi:eukaryotic-like serine/threonine-protein kinase
MGKLDAGHVIDGKYRLVEPLGQGGMSMVWRARHENLKTDLAIKFVTEKYADDPEAAALVLERFRFEAQISARLGARTKHVVSVQDAGSHEGAPYLVMELVEGRTLEEELDRTGTMDPARLADIFDQVADALSVAHDLGIVHRDMKPSNLLVVDEANNRPFVKVADFGIAKATRSDSTFDRPTETSQGFLVGSPAFMSPEQLRPGSPIDARTDVWGMGVVAYEALTGNLPFIGMTEADLIVAISTITPESPRKLRRDLPRGVGAWISRALAKDPEHRFQTVDEAARAFRAALQPVAKTPRFGAIAIGALVTVAGIAGLLFVRDRSSGPAERVQQAVAASPPPPSAAPAPSPTAAPAASTPPEQPAPSASEAQAAPSAAPRRARGAPRARPARAPTATAEPPTEQPPRTRARKEIDPSEIQ